MWATSKNKDGFSVAFAPPREGDFYSIFPDKNAATLLPLIMQHIEPGNIIQTDGLASYNRIVNLPANPPFQHLVVIHDQNFVDPVTGACTNHVQCFWKNCKRRFEHMARVQNSTLEGHLDEFLWRETFGKSGQEALTNILNQLSQWFQLP
ncbi:hypothetical protein PoB_002936900 [Plakobranchus ocellatus]|uniref:ISXO2-like transposase domain-containing protein n=1 Tax=Plakobranchus ocellatus TaxID=259542 RepID=A0AAV4A9F4_9GAST|nr:hypothetical protein PoB_002936900 [Plakobranchus ocellatus]